MPIVNGTWLPTHVTDPYDRDEAILWAVASFVIFMSLAYDFKHRFSIPKKQSEYGPRVISLIHAIISTPASFYVVFHHEGGWFDQPTTRLQGCWQAFSWSYFLADSLDMIFFSNWDTTFALHHLVTLFCFGRPAFLGLGGFVMTFATIGGEFTNIFMHTRWLLHAERERLDDEKDADTKKAYSRYIKLLGHFWFVTFFVLRFGIAPFVCYHLLLTFPLYFSPLIVGLLVVSWHVFVKFARMEMRGEWWTG